MADRTVQILPGGQSAAPFTYTVPASTAFTLLAVRAVFDGTGAAGNFVPLVQLVSDAGVVMAQRKGDSVTAGASADVTFAPFDRSGSSGGVTDPNAVHYNVPGETGTFIDSTTTVGGVTFEDHSGSGIQLHSENPGGLTGGFIAITTAAGTLDVTSADMAFDINPPLGSFEVQSSSAPVMTITHGQYVTIRLGAGQSLDIRGPLSTPIMRIDEGGGTPTYHIKTGAVWVADL